MKFSFWILILNLVFLQANNSFITKMEYATMLYQNPRGIGCDKCHGIKGEGTIIAKYKEKGEIKYLKAPSINNLSRKEFFQVFKNKKYKIMPKYFLTNKEINTLYLYLQKINKKTKKVKK